LGASGDAERVASISVRYGVALAKHAVPEWQATLDALQICRRSGITWIR
jgi:hypothetical protein